MFFATLSMELPPSENLHPCFCYARGRSIQTSSRCSISDTAQVFPFTLSARLRAFVADGSTLPSTHIATTFRLCLNLEKQTLCRPTINLIKLTRNSVIRPFFLQSAPRSTAPLSRALERLDPHSPARTPYECHYGTCVPRRRAVDAEVEVVRERMQHRTACPEQGNQPVAAVSTNRSNCVVHRRHSPERVIRITLNRPAAADVYQSRDIPGGVFCTQAVNRGSRWHVSRSRRNHRIDGCRRPTRTHLRRAAEALLQHCTRAE